MKNVYCVVIFVCFFVLSAEVFSQTNADRRIIEVTGSAEMILTPNLFTFKIRLIERIENKQKLTIEMQETNLKNELAKIGIDVAKDLTVFDLTSVYVPQRRTRDTIANKDYRLKLRDLEKIEKLLEIADRLNIADLELIDSTHTELTRFRQETKTEAIKAARFKAEYMLNAIGEKVGKAFFIKEIEESPTSRSGNSNFSSNAYSANTNVISFEASNIKTSDSRESQTALTLSQIRIRYEVFAKFEIE